MKNTLIHIAIVAIFLSAVSCDSKKENNTFEPTIEKFSNDERVLSVVNSFEELLNQSPYDKNFDIKSFRNSISSIKLVINQIYKDYGGEDNVISFCHELSGNVHTKNEGDCCELNPNGTTNWDCCSNWQSFLVACASVFRCDADGDVGTYYDCVQERVCNNC